MGIMRTLLCILLFSGFATSFTVAASKVRWPRDVVEWEKLKEAEETAKKEGKGLAFVFVPVEWPEDLNGSVGRSISVTNDTIRALKSFCLIVKGNMQAVRAASQGKEDAAPKVLVAGMNAAGNTYPLVVILDTEMKVVLGATSGKNISTEGKKIFRAAKKMFRELEKEKEEEK